MILQLKLHLFFQNSVTGEVPELMKFVLVATIVEPSLRSMLTSITSFQLEVHQFASKVWPRLITQLDEL